MEPLCQTVGQRGTSDELFSGEGILPMTSEFFFLSLCKLLSFQRCLTAKFAGPPFVQKLLLWDKCNGS